jgi:Cu/Zn superoxide dismutase
MTTRKRFIALLLGPALVLGFTSGARAADSITVKLAPQSSSGESGTATLTKAGDKQTKVVLSVSGAPADAQPTHIHKGSCANLDPKPAFPLSPVTGGKSETVVNASLEDLEKGYAINGHKSAQDLKTYVFCGDIKGM